MQRPGAHRPAADDKPPTIHVEPHNGVQAMLAFAVAVCVFSAFEAFGRAFSGFYEGWTLRTGLMLVKSMTCVAIAAAAVLNRQLLWAVYITTFTLQTGLLATSALVGARHMLEMQQPLIAGVALVVSAAGAISLVGGCAMALAVWRRYEAFDIAAHHRWRYLVRYGVAPSALIVIIDAYALYGRYLARN